MVGIVFPLSGSGVATPEEFFERIVRVSLESEDSVCLFSGLPFPGLLADTLPGTILPALSSVLRKVG
jgi:hypothetical protein